MWVYFFLIVVILIWGGYVAWRWKQAKDFAPVMLAARKETGEIPESVTEGEFTDLYLRAEGPRSATYIYACAVFMTLAIGPLSLFFNFIWNTAWRLTGQLPVFEEGTLIHTFTFFLAYMGFTILLLTLAFRRFHATAPPSLKQVIRHLKDKHA